MIYYMLCHNAKDHFFAIDVTGFWNQKLEQLQISIEHKRFLEK
jgi:hypothetical protein